LHRSQQHSEQQEPHNFKIKPAITSGGEHRYFLAPPDRDLRSTSAALGWKVDTRAAGGAIIAAGSVRRIQGQRRWYRVVCDLDPIALPSWLVTALTPAPVPVRAPIPRSSTRRRREAYVSAALESEAATVTQAAPGTRAHTLFTAAARLGELIGAGVAGRDPRHRDSPERRCGPGPQR
jgi:hypothetical protein